MLAKSLLQEIKHCAQQAKMATKEVLYKEKAITIICIRETKHKGKPNDQFLNHCQTKPFISTILTDCSARKRKSASNISLVKVLPYKKRQTYTLVRTKREYRGKGNNLF